MARADDGGARRLPTATYLAATATSRQDAAGHAGRTTARQMATVHGYDYLARIWLDGPLPLAETALQAWLAALVQVDAGLAERCAGLVRLLDVPAERTAAGEDYQNCLVVPQTGRYVPPYAAVWLDGARQLWGPATIRVLSCYEQAGLDWTGGSSHQEGRPWVRAPDHLGVECAFVADLAAGMNEVVADPAVLATRFIVDHLRAWVPAYAAVFARHAVSRYWRGMAEVLQIWVGRDALLPEQPDPRAPTRAGNPQLASRSRCQPGRRPWPDLGGPSRAV